MFSILSFLVLSVAIIYFGIKGELSAFQELLLWALIFGFILINRRIADIRDQLAGFFNGLSRGLIFEHTYEDEEDDDPPYTNGRHPVMN